MCHCFFFILFFLEFARNLRMEREKWTFLGANASFSWIQLMHTTLYLSVCFASRAAISNCKISFRLRFSREFIVNDFPRCQTLLPFQWSTHFRWPSKNVEHLFQVKHVAFVGISMSYQEIAGNLRWNHRSILGHKQTWIKIIIWDFFHFFSPSSMCHTTVRCAHIVVATTQHNNLRYNTWADLKKKIIHIQYFGIVNYSMNRCCLG